MRRRFFNIFSAFSLLICVVISVVAATRSSNEKPFWRHEEANRCWAWTLDSYGIRFESLSDPSGKIIALSAGTHFTPSSIDTDFHIDLANGFEFPLLFVYRQGDDFDFTDGVFPLHIQYVLLEYQGIGGAAAIAPLFWLLSQFFRRRTHRARLKKQLCIRCGYDLRATPDV